MRNTDDSRDTCREYAIAMVHVSRCLRHGRIADVKEWLGIAERLLKAHRHLDAIRAADDKRQAFRAEHPHKLKALEHRARFPR